MTKENTLPLSGGGEGEGTKPVPPGILPFIEDLRSRGLIREDQARVLTEIHSHKLISVLPEIRALYTLGLASFLYGIGLTLAKYYDQLGHAPIITALGLGILACSVYVLKKAPPFSRGPVPSPTLAFDFVLLLGCLLLGTEVSYVEYHFHLLKEYWDWYLLVAAGGLLGLAYRFDNRLVLSLGLSTLAAWWGIKLDLSLARYPNL